MDPNYFPNIPTINLPQIINPILETNNPDYGTGMFDDVILVIVGLAVVLGLLGLFALGFGTASCLPKQLQAHAGLQAVFMCLSIVMLALAQDQTDDFLWEFTINDEINWLAIARWLSLCLSMSFWVFALLAPTWEFMLSLKTRLGTPITTTTAMLTSLLTAANLTTVACCLIDGDYPMAFSAAI